RMAWICDSARQVADALAAHPAVAAVAYPGLAAGEAGEVVARMLPAGHGGMIRLRLSGGEPAVAPFLHALRLIVYAGSLGGTATTICRPPRRVPCDDTDRAEGGFLRLSIGLESAADIIGDLKAALDTVAGGASIRQEVQTA
ncbi:MAG: PLP-dependent transferase, partial [Thermomicrobiales bacterium]